MNNGGWQDARRDAGLPLVRIHDLRHAFACRLRAAGVSAEDREALLGHANHSMAGHYASADVGRLLKQANLLLDRSGTRTLLRVADSQRGRVDKSFHRVPQQARRTWFCKVLEFCLGRAEQWISGPTTVPQQEGGLGFRCQVLEFLRVLAGLEPTTPWFVPRPYFGLGSERAIPTQRASYCLVSACLRFAL
jgi:integrase-like protein